MSSSDYKPSGESGDSIPIKDKRAVSLFVVPFLSNEVGNHQADSIRRHTQTGRPLDTAEFVHNLEQVTGKPLAPKRLGRKPAKSK